MIIILCLAPNWSKEESRYKHLDIYEDSSVYMYEHLHGQIVAPKERHAVTPWILFLVFVLGPCEPMIPLLYFPAAKNSLFGIMLLILVYTLFTLATMLLMVVLGYFGFIFIKTEKLERYVHALSGITMFICGAGMVFLGW